MNYFEVLFDITYLISVIGLSFVITRKGIRTKRKELILFGVMGLLLGFGDSFHLIPRIIAHLTTGLDDYALYLGIGKLITGITMTFFYYLLFLVFELKQNKKYPSVKITIIVLSLIRFIIFALPGNEWILNSNNLIYAVVRNVPFAIIGGIIIYYFYKSKSSLFKLLANYIIISFVCYIIVIVGSGFVPVLGALMMPKTVAYFLIIYTGFKQL